MQDHRRTSGILLGFRSAGAGGGPLQFMRFEPPAKEQPHDPVAKLASIGLFLRRAFFLAAPATVLTPTRGGATAPRIRSARRIREEESLKRLS